MDSRQVNKELRAVVRPLLQTHGFTLFTTRTAWRTSANRVDVVNFQSFNEYLANGCGCTTYSFALNIGIYLLSIPDPRPADTPRDKSGALRPNYWHCHLQRALERTIDQPELHRRDIWYIDEFGQYLTPAVRDARSTLSNVGLDWFERWSDAAILAELLTDVVVPDDDTRLPGNPGSLVRSYVAGYVAKHLGERAVAAEQLRHSLALYEKFDAENAKTTRAYKPRVPDQLRTDVAELGGAL
jgi:hypothetical protein